MGRADDDDIIKSLENFLNSFPQAGKSYTAQQLLSCMNGLPNLNKAVAKVLESKHYDKNENEISPFAFAAVKSPRELKVLIMGQPFQQHWPRQYFLKQLEQPFRVENAELVEQATMKVSISEEENPHESFEVVIPYFELSLQIRHVPNPFSSKREEMVASEYTENSKWMQFGTQILENLALHFGYNPDKSPSDLKGLALIPPGHFLRWHGHHEVIFNLWIHNMSQNNKKQRAIS